MRAPYTAFCETRMVPVEVYQGSSKIDADTWDETIWVEASECWFALTSSQLRHRKVRVIERDKWLR